MLRVQKDCFHVVILSFCRELFDDVRIDSNVRVDGRESSKKHGRLYTDIRPMCYRNRQVVTSYVESRRI